MPVFFFVKIFELFLVLFGECSFELGEGILRRCFPKWTTLNVQGSVNARIRVEKEKSLTHPTETMYEELQCAYFVVVNGIWEVEFSE